MEPIDESARAVEALDAGIDDVHLLDELRARSDRVTRVVPDCIGLSVAVRELGITLTLLSTHRRATLLDGMQYLDSGPCVRAAERGEELAFTAEELFSEESWRLFSQAATLSGVASTLSLPVIVDDEVSGTVNLYGSTPHAFDGHHDELAEIFGAWAGGVTTNADLSFATLETARHAPRILADQVTLETAIGLVMASVRVSSDEARRRVADAARRSGVSEIELAEAVVASGPNRESWPEGLLSRDWP